MICPVCQSHEITFEGKVDRFKPSLEIQRCESCCSLFQFPLPPDHEKFYDEKYYSGQAEFSYIDERKSNQFNKYVWDARIKNILQFHNHGIFLDVGCSFGGLVRSASEYFDAYGIDISPYAINYGNDFSRQIQPSPKFKGLFKGSLIDFPAELTEMSSIAVITMIEVIEHLENPRAHIKKAYDLLQPGGLLVIQTANMTAYQAVSEGLNYHYYLPGHLSYFSREGMKLMLSETGFTFFKEYFPTDFGLIAKLKKLSGTIVNISQVSRFLKTTRYHLISYLKKNGRPRTSSYVIYAFKSANPD